MKPAPHKEVNNLISQLLTRIKAILGKKLIGLYLEGSLVLGDFDPETSDIDLVAILESDVNDQEFEKLQKMHEDLENNHKLWINRIEVCYISKDAINSTRTKKSNIVNISPGEPFHRTKSQKEWLMNWYLTREKSKTLFGPDPKTTIDPISKEEFIQSVKDHAKSWGDWVGRMRNRYAQSYAILTMCRALYAYKNGDQISKTQAAAWAKKELPSRSELIDKALIWKKAGPKDKDVNNEVDFPKTVEFTNFIRALILDN